MNPAHLFRPRISPKERAIYFRSLGTMFESGVPLVQALYHMGHQGESELLREISVQLAGALSSGHRLSKAMSQHPALFSKTECRLVHSGEESGRLAHVLLNLATAQERRLTLQRKVQGALITPLMVSGFCLLLVIFVPPMLFKGLFELLGDTDTPMPWPTRVLMSFSQAVTHPLCYVLLAALGTLGWWGGRHLWRRPVWKKRLWGLVLSIPVLGPTLRMLAVVQFSQNLVQVLEVGVPLLPSLEMAAQASGNYLLEQRVRQHSLQSLQEGETVSRALREADFFPDGYLQSLRAGEEGSHLVQLLNSLINLYQLELDHRLELLTQILEPLMMAIVGTIVGFTCLATLLPTLKVMENL